MKRILIYIFIAAVVLCTLFFIFRAKDKDKTGDDMRVGQASVSVDAAPAVFHEFQDRIDAVGTLRARETNLLSPKVTGNVDTVLVDIGDWVEAGQVVVLLDSTLFELGVDQSEAACQAANAALAQALSQFEQAQKEYRRASKLLAEKVISQTRFDAAEAAYKATREGLAVAKGKYSQAQAAMKTAREYLKDASIRSSIAGVVVDRNVEVGQSISPGVQIFRILDQTTMKGDVELPEKDCGRVTVGTAAVITVDAFQRQEFSGKVTIINPMVDPRARTFRVRIETPNPSGKLVDGMFARVRFLTGQRTALAVPRDALHRLSGSGTFYVFVVQGDKVVKRTVETGKTGDQYAEVIEGLVEGERVVTSGDGRLRSGMSVTVFSETSGERKITHKEKQQ